MPSDVRVAAAREHHRAAAAAREDERRHLGERNRLIRQLYAEGGWSYGRLASAVGCTPDLVAKIINPQER